MKDSTGVKRFKKKLVQRRVLCSHLSPNFCTALSPEPQLLVVVEQLSPLPQLIQRVHPLVEELSGFGRSNARDSAELVDGYHVITGSNLRKIVIHSHMVATHAHNIVTIVVTIYSHDTLAYFLQHSLVTLIRFRS